MSQGGRTCQEEFVFIPIVNSEKNGCEEASFRPLAGGEGVHSMHTPQVI